MIDVIKKINDMRPTVITDKFNDGVDNGIKLAVSELNKYNILATDKTINLSTIIKKLNLAFPKIIRENNKIRVYNGKALMLNVIDNHIQPINVLPSPSNKWF